MGLQLESGAGNGASAIITDDGRQNTSARSTSRLYYQSKEGTRGYSWQSLTYNYTAADTILLVKNTSTVETLVIHSISFSGDTTSVWHIHRPTTDVTVAGTTVTGANLNGLSSTPALATAAADETGNSQGTILYSATVLANTTYCVTDKTIGTAIRLGTNQSIAVDVVTVGAAAVCSIVGFYESESPVGA